MTKRKTISKRLRFEVFKRDSFTCQYCSSKPPKVPLEVDHIIPVSKNGGNEIDNLITACFDCNRGKSNIELENVPMSLSEKVKRRKIAQRQYVEYKAILDNDKRIMDEDIERVENVYNASFDDYVFQEHFKITVKKFIEQLGIQDVVDSMEIACSKIYYDEKKALKYFCGICWNKIRGN